MIVEYTSYIQLNIHSFRYFIYEWSMDDDAPGHRETGRATMSRLKGGLQPQLCNEAHDDNDTPA